MKELLRDKVRITFTFIGPLILLLTAVACISFDIENIHFSVVDEDNTALSHELIQSFNGSKYFKQVSQLHALPQVVQELQKRNVDLIIHIPAHYEKDLSRQQHPQIDFLIDGAQPFKASSIKEYISGIMLIDNINYLQRNAPTQPVIIPQFIEPRFMYNHEFKTIYSIVPGMIMLTLILMTIMLTALGIVREKEKGSIINFNSSPARPLQYLLGKQFPYVVLAFLSALCLIVFSVLIVGVPYKGSLLALLIGVALYLWAVSGLGLLLSTFAKQEIVVLFLAAIITLIPASNFSGLIYPVSTLTGIEYWIGHLFPASWFQKISVGVFNKGLDVTSLGISYLALLGFTCTFILLATLFLRKQES